MLTNKISTKGQIFHRLFIRLFWVGLGFSAGLLVGAVSGEVAGFLVFSAAIIILGVVAIGVTADCFRLSRRKHV